MKSKIILIFIALVECFVVQAAQEENVQPFVIKQRAALDNIEWLKGRLASGNTQVQANAQKILYGASLRLQQKIQESLAQKKLEAVAQELSEHKSITVPEAQNLQEQAAVRLPKAAEILLLRRLEAQT